MSRVKEYSRSGCVVTSRMYGIDLFSGAGGMSVGAQASGIDVKFAIDSDPKACATYEANHPETEVVCKNIDEIEDFSVYRPNGDFVLFGGPPCQGFSTSNQRTRTQQNPKNWLFRHFVRAVSQMQPILVVFENVKGLLETEDRFFLNQLVNDLEKVGYSSAYKLLNSQDFGVPQNRSRLFLVASKSKEWLTFPAATCQPRITVRHALDALPSLRNGEMGGTLPYTGSSKSRYAKSLRARMRQCDGHDVSRNAEYVIERYRHIPPGGNWQDIPSHLMENYADRNRCHTGIYRRLKLDQPSVVIGNYRKNMLIHPTEDRGLSVREAARLQSFPDRYSFKGTIGFKQQQVGNAVPPLLAKAVFSRLLDM